MNITQVTASFKRTQSLPGYCNVSASFTLTADLSDGDTPVAVERRLRDELELIVNEWIDAALEDAGQPARFSADPRYDLLWWRSGELALIAPHISPMHRDALRSLPGDWKYYVGEGDDCYTNQRLPNLRRMANDIGLPYCREFSTIEDVRSWAHSHLSLAGLWSIVGIYILDPASEREYPCWEYLGRIAITGEVYAQLTTDPTLKVEPVSMTGSVGIHLSDIANKSIPVIKTSEDVRLWLQDQILEAHPPDEDDGGDLEEIDDTYS